MRVDAPPLPPFEGFNDEVYRIIIVALLYYSALAWVVWHAPVVKIMAPEDWLTRVGLFILVVTLASSNLATLLGWDSIWRQPAFVVGGFMLATGLTMLLWKHRNDRSTAAVESARTLLRTEGPQMSTTVVKSTANLTADGIGGYAKSIAAFLSGFLAVLVQFITDETWGKYVTAAIALLGFIAVYGLPNKVQPVVVVDADPTGTTYPNASSV